MGITHPIWLWGLLGLAVPVAIHLLSRKESRVIRIGSLRHLENATTRQVMSIRLNALWLLALRCMVVTLVTLLLARLYIAGERKQERWVVIEQGLERQEPWTQVIDSLEAQGYVAKRLSSGFPDAGSTEPPHATTPDYWTLTEALSGVQLDRCVVISRNRMAGFAGARPVLPGHITWLTAAADSTEYLLLSKKTGDDSVVVRAGRSNGQLTSYTTFQMPGTESDPSRRRIAGDSVPLAAAPKEIRVVVAGNENEEEKRVITASLQAISENALTPVQITAASGEDLPGDADWLIWLRSGDMPRTNIPNVIRKRSMASVPADHANITHSLLEAEACPDKASCWTITRSLTPATAMEEQFTLRLARLLLGDVAARLATGATAYDRRMLPEDATFSSAAPGNVATSISKNAQRDSSGVIALALVALLIVERFTANRQQL